MSDELAALRAQLRVVSDRLELRELAERYVTVLDTVGERGHDDDWFRTVFTDDARLDFPIGSRRGVTGLAAFHREAHGWWRHTHHLGTLQGIHVEDDTARLRVHQLTTHVHGAGPHQGSHFDVGGHYEVHARRTPDGWRIDRLAFHVVWTRGERLAHMTDKEL